MLALQPVQRQRMALPCISFATQKKQWCYALPLTAARRQRCRLDVVGVAARGLRQRLRLVGFVGVQRLVQAGPPPPPRLLAGPGGGVGHPPAPPPPPRPERKKPSPPPLGTS